MHKGKFPRDHSSCKKGKMCTIDVNGAMLSQLWMYSNIKINIGSIKPRPNTQQSEEARNRTEQNKM